MGVDFLVCSYCEDTFPDCGHFVSCECGERWCDERCAGYDGYTEGEEPEDWNEDEDGEWEEDESKSCKYCRGEDHADWVLLDYALELLNMKRQDIIQKYNEEKGDK